MSGNSLVQKEYVGLRIGELTVLSELDPHVTPNGTRQRIVQVLCSCGRIYNVRLSNALKYQKCKDCQWRAKRIDISGRRFGRLVVISMADDYISPGGHRLSRCLCKCDCGKEIIVNMDSLITGKTRSCGCLHNTRGLLKDYPELVAKYDFQLNAEVGIDYESLTAKSSRKVWWKCPNCGHSWLATIASQNDAKKHGCPYCSGRLPSKGKNDLATLFPEVAMEWNYGKNGDLMPDSVTAQSGLKVWWVCREGHEWQAQIRNRTINGSGCPRCNFENVNSFCEQAVFFYVKKVFPDAINGDSSFGFELDIFIPSIKTAIEYDGEAWHASDERIGNDNNKNNLCISNSIVLYRIREPRLPPICNCKTIIRSDSVSEASLDAAITELLRSLGALTIDVDTKRDEGLILSQFAQKKFNNSLLECFPDIANELHPTRNGTLTADKLSKFSRRKVWWLGKCGHEWQMAVCDRTRPLYYDKNGKAHKPQGCPYCSGKRILIGYNDLQSKYPTVAAEWHPSKNANMLPTDVSPGSRKRIWWLCKCGHEWIATPEQRCLANQGCPACYRSSISPSVMCVETGKVYKNAYEAGLDIGAKCYKTIYKCCRGEQKKAYGFHWSYAH